MSNTIWLPAIISDNMVLQARQRIKLWGKAVPHEKIRAQIAGKSATTTTDRLGRFEFTLPPLKPGGPHQFRIRGFTEKMINNVLIGDVWVCSGQSNMEMSVGASKDAKLECAAALFPKIRLFTVPARASSELLDAAEGCWRECDPQSVRDFSAVGYFFGRDIYKQLRQPLGLINTSWGGTRIEPWISLPALRTCNPAPQTMKTYQKFISGSGRKALCGSFYKDTSNTGLGRGWANEHCDTSAWKTLKIPGYWTEGVKKVGAFWFRRSVELPRSWRGQDLRLNLGALVDFDTTYFNGEQIGAIPQGTYGAWATPRSYVIPASIAKTGRNAIAVRIFAHGVNGGFSGPADALSLSVINRPENGRIELAGNWKYAVERGEKQLGPVNRALVPATLYNAMIHPLTSFAIRGFLWYQGESNVSDPLEYQKLMPLLINDWRKQWGQAALPFYLVQLSDYDRKTDNDLLARLREAQLLSTRTPHTGMAISLDGGEKDIHALNKQLVGHRLALLALAKTYGKKMECSGPIYRSFKIESDRIRIAFDHIGKGLATSDGRPPAEFTIAGADRVFVPAKAAIEKDTVIVWSNQVRAPKAARYAWADAPRCPLINKSKLPASPFRTDDWDG